MNRTELNLRTLDALRGALATYVMLGHCRWLLWTGHASWMAAPHSAIAEPFVYASAAFRYGREAVMIFFALSGFFIHLRAAQEASWQGTFDARRFYARRWHRLGAPYVFALVVTVILDAAGRTWWPTLYQAQTGDTLVDGVFARTGYTWWSVVPAMVVLPSSLGYDFGTNGPLWSLAFEVVYYLLYPAWLMVRRAGVVAAYGVIPVACLVVSLLPQAGFATIVLALYPVWLSGAALAEWMTSGRAVRIDVALGLFAGGSVLHAVSPSLVMTGMAAVLYGAGAVALSAALPMSLNGSLAARALEFLGVRSYSIYITHFPLVALFSAFLFQSGGRPPAGWAAVGGASVALAFGCVCFELCERHYVHHRVPAASHAGAVA